MLPYSNNYYMNVVHIKRRTKTKKQYNERIGLLTTKITYIKKYFIGVPIKTVHQYGRTYYGQGKKSDDCFLFV